MDMCFQEQAGGQPWFRGRIWSEWALLVVHRPQHFLYFSCVMSLNCWSLVGPTTNMLEKNSNPNQCIKLISFTYLSLFCQPICIPRTPVRKEALFESIVKHGIK